MNIDVTLESGLRDAQLDSVQTFSWPFGINWQENRDLAQGDLILTKLGPGLKAGPGQKDLIFSWEDLLRQWQREKSFLKTSPLIKALGLKKGNVEEAIDATLGLGRDSAQILAAGFKVSAFERNPKIFFLAKAAQLMERTLDDRLEISFGSCEENSRSCPIYFDPMFDDGKQRKALPNKGMALFHDIVGGDADAKNEAQRLLNMTKRLVIKRPPKLDALLEKRNSCWESKAVRFDLYLGS